MSCTSDIPTYCRELFIQYRSMVALYKYDLHYCLGGFSEDLDNLTLEEGFRILSYFPEDCFLFRRSKRFPISPTNLRHSEKFKNSCMTPKGEIIMRYDFVLLTSYEVADIFKVSHQELLEDLRSFKSDLEIFEKLIHRCGV